MRAANVLYYGDNLEILRRYLREETVDLVYLDPPFKSNQDYNVLFAQHGERSAAQIKAFEDTWQWDKAAASAYQETVERGGHVAQAMLAFRTLLGTSDMLAYLSMMAPRLVELHRVLKTTGSLYLHCDPAASHYLKLLLDAVFGPRLFRSEVVWKRSSAHSSSKRFSPVHDTILFYSKSESHTWNPVYQPLPEETINQWYNNVEADTGRRYNRADLTAAGVRAGPSGTAWRGVDPSKKGRHWAIPGFVGDVVAGKSTLEALDALDAAGRIHWPKRAGGIPMLKRYLDESKGIPALDVITHISPLNNVAAERLGYPTQKPEALLEVLVEASSNEGDLVLDPFCGCGTAVAVAQRLGRRWIGIDITHLAISLIRHRLRDAHGEAIAQTYEIVGEPVSAEDARQLAADDPFQFQWWALGLVGARSTQQKRGADRGIDGYLYFHEDGDPKTRRIVISVKGGKPAASHLRDLLGVVERDRADIGVLITLHQPTHAMRRDAASAGFYESSAKGLYPRLQILTVEELLSGETIYYPLTGPGLRAQAPRAMEQLVLGDIADDYEHATKSPVTGKRPALSDRPRSTADLVDDLLRRARVDRPPVRLEPVLEQLGIELSADPRLKEDALLVPMTDPRLGPPAAWTVYYNPSKPEARRRFTIAHEVGHVLLHGEPLSAQARGAAVRRKSREREVESFAAELLMPARMVRTAVEEFGPDTKSLCSVFQVSQASMEIRLRELGLG